MRRRDQPWAANCCMLFCSFTLRTFAIVPADLPYTEHSAETNRRLKVGNLESVKRDHFRPEVVPFQRPLTSGGPWMWHVVAFRLEATIVAEADRLEPIGRDRCWTEPDPRKGVSPQNHCSEEPSDEQFVLAT